MASIAKFAPLVLGSALLCGCGPEQPKTDRSTADTPTTTHVVAEVEPVKVTTTAAPVMPVPDAIAVAVASPDRPADDVARDADRKPADVLTYFEVHPDEVVFELVAGGGYYTELFSRIVGTSGRVVATRLAPERLAAGGRLPNVTAAADRDWGLAANSVDLAFTSLNYHDLINLKVDRPALLKGIMTVLKPGATFAVIDHAAADGSGVRDVGTLHRVDEAVVISEITAGGFELVDESTLLRHPEDDRTLPVFDPKIRGKTDQFILKFRKP